MPTLSGGCALYALAIGLPAVTGQSGLVSVRAGRARYLAVRHRSIRPRKFLSRKGRRRCHSRDLGGTGASNGPDRHYARGHVHRAAGKAEAQQIIR